MPTKAFPETAQHETIIRKELRRAMADTRYLEQRWDDFLKDHNGERVGIFKREALFEKTLDGLIEQARSHGWDPGLMVVDRLVEERPAVAL